MAGATWQHPSVIALMSQHPAHRDPEAVIRQLARELACANRALGWSGPPFDPEILASLLGITIAAGPPDLAQDALIRPVEGGALEIIYNPTIPRTRRNFSIFHEITHTLFPDCYETVRHRAKRRAALDPGHELEALCDAGASELLLPLPEFSEDVRRVGFGLSAVEMLRERYAASREATSIRLVNVSSAPCAAAVLSFRLKPAERAAVRQTTMPFAPGPQPRLRVDLMVTSSTFGGQWLPKHKSIPDESALYRLLGQGVGPAVVTAIEVWDAGKRLLPRCTIEAMSIPPDGEGQARVMALLQVHR